MHPLTQPTQHKRRSAWAQPMKKMTRRLVQKCLPVRLGTANAADTISNQVGAVIIQELGRRNLSKLGLASCVKRKSLLRPSSIFSELRAKSKAAIQSVGHHLIHAPNIYSQQPDNRATQLNTT